MSDAPRSGAAVLDPRIQVFRPDLACASLRDRFVASRYVTPQLRQCLRGVLPLFDRPASDAIQISQIRYGEFFDLYELRDDGFAWVQNRSDQYVGYVPAAPRDMGETVATLSNRVTALRSFVFPTPSARSTPTDELTLGSYVGIGGTHGKFIELASGGFVVESHVMAAEFAHSPDYVFTAGRLLNTPYMWGGRTPRGIDCSGLVQLALELAGIEAPRDCDQQCAALAQPLTAHWRDRAWARGDIVFTRSAQRTDDRPTPDHLGFMTDGDDLIHASGHSMTVTVEPLADLVARGNDVIAVAEARRLRCL